MIVQYNWLTTRGPAWRPLHTAWRGWFLFGIVPLYIAIQNREYPR